MKPINILSIDFDYFQNVDSKTLLMHYPDGIDLPEELSRFIWVSHYANPYAEKELLNVKIKQDKLNELMSYIKTINNKIPVMIASSHLSIYDFIHKYCNINDNLNIINLDMHHDMFDAAPDKIHCGNWLKYIIQEYKNVNTTWICNPVSLETMNNPDINTIIDDLISLKNIDFDMIFLCRSDNWSAPHLDDYFVILAECLGKISSNLDLENVLEPRYNQNFKEMVDEERNIINSINKNI